MKLVKVVWEDASQEAAVWVDTDSAEPMPVVVFEQVGWLLSHTTREVVLTQAIQEGQKGLAATRQRIPRGMVRSIVTLVDGDPVHLTTRKPRTKDTA